MSDLADLDQSDLDQSNDVMLQARVPSFAQYTVWRGVHFKSYAFKFPFRMTKRNTGNFIVT